MQDFAPSKTPAAPLGEVQHRFRAMHAASRNEPPTDVRQRKQQLRRLRQMLSDHTPAFLQAIAADYGCRAEAETLMTEVVPALTMVGGAFSNVGRWMRPERRGRSMLFWPGRNEVHWQPKGVVLVISPWNYPLQLTVGPVAAAIAAGNRVIVKPSEMTPATSTLLKQRLEKALGPDWVTVATGGPEIAEGLCRLPFDHILFTGSTSVGRKVMAAAAENLTPVTLELGGKSPAIIHPDYSLGLAAQRLVKGKLLNAGQTCIAPDYALVHRDQTEAFLAEFRKAVAAYYPSILANGDYTSIINERHYRRLIGLLEDARAKGARIEVADPAGELKGGWGSPDLRKVAPAAVLGVSDEMTIAKEEIFGPLLPVIPYDTLDEAIAYVNARPRPLALYYFDANSARIRQVLGSTVSGGASVGDTIYHFAQEELPFGGIGPSGMGSYHGHDGFRTLSHAKGVFRQRRIAVTDLLSPPYDKAFRRVIDFAVWFSGGRS